MMMYSRALLLAPKLHKEKRWRGGRGRSGLQRSQINLVLRLFCASPPQRQARAPLAAVVWPAWPPRSRRPEWLRLAPPTVDAPPSGATLPSTPRRCALLLERRGGRAGRNVTPPPTPRIIALLRRKKKKECLVDSGR
ncbi:hypothetical protein HPB50_021955 [Hyalomma asiaticum]|uniref:Uncharacterized protein n=1 Tax=Hyalomma asiaticum TaxID=266040 RepID=A0ACB7TLD1_HYAAI|nr:hypothetical protein HPB50_021955 [Hyalomma asiaticum]